MFIRGFTFKRLLFCLFFELAVRKDGLCRFLRALSYNYDLKDHILSNIM